MTKKNNSIKNMRCKYCWELPRKKIGIKNHKKCVYCGRKNRIKRRMIIVKPFFKKEDFWIGIYYDKDERIIYFCPFPMIGLKIKLRKIEVSR